MSPLSFQEVLIKSNKAGPSCLPFFLCWPPLGDTPTLQTGIRTESSCVCVMPLNFAKCELNTPLLFEVACLCYFVMAMQSRMIGEKKKQANLKRLRKNNQKMKVHQKDIFCCWLEHFANKIKGTNLLGHIRH